MAHIEVRTEAEILADGQALIDVTEDMSVTTDVRQELEETWVEQTNNSIGVAADGTFPLVKEVHSPRVQEFIDAANDDDEDC